jgi:hypothetical protein
MPLSLALLLSQLPAASLYMNQAAFEAHGPKTAIIEGPSGMAGQAFTLKRSGNPAGGGVLSPAVQLSDWKSGVSFYEARFDSVKTPGTYTLTLPDGTVSGSFAIGKDTLINLGLSKILTYFKADRWSGADNVTKFGGGSTTYDMQGGWKDATGDVSKYLSHLSYANYMNPQQIPLSTWVLAFTADRMPTLLKAKGNYTGMRAEALWGADYLVRSLDAAGYFYITVFDGWNVDSVRNICAFSGSKGIRSSDYQAAWREGAGMAIAALARVSTWGVNGAKTSAQYLAAAKTGYAHLKTKGIAAYADDGKENILDDYTALMAASELYAATSTETYLTDARARAVKLAARLSPDGYFWSDDAKTRPFYHAVDAGLPLVALTRYLEVDSLQSDSTVAKAITKHLNYLTTVTSKVANPFGYARQTFRHGGSIKEGFFIPHENESGYWWQGENARLGSLASAAFYAGRFVGYRTDSAFGLPDSLLRYGISQIDWILGKNPKDYSFMAGVGRKQAPGYYVVSNGEHVGGIVNGITGSNDRTDGTGIDYKVAADFPMNPPAYTVGPWFSWRWTEQWIPHAHWFLMSMASLGDEVRTSVKTPSLAIATKAPRALRATFVRTGNRLEIRLASPAPRDSRFQVSDLRGRLVAQSVVPAGQYATTLDLPASHEMLVVTGSEGSALIRP